MSLGVALDPFAASMTAQAQARQRRVQGATGMRRAALPSGVGLMFNSAQHEGPHGIGVFLRSPYQGRAQSGRQRGATQGCRADLGACNLDQGSAIPHPDQSPAPQVTPRPLPAGLSAALPSYVKPLMWRVILWCCERGLNSRPHPYQGCALPLSYHSAGRTRRSRAAD